MPNKPNNRVKELLKVLSPSTGGAPYGNRNAATENFTPESHERRIRGLFKFWANTERRKRGEVIMKHPRTEKRSARKREPEALEARQVTEFCRKAAPDALVTLKDIINNPAERAADRIAACEKLLDRGYGKASQVHTNVNIEANASITEVSTNELTTRIEETIRAIEITRSRTVKKEEGQKRLVDLRKRDGDPGGSTFH